MSRRLPLLLCVLATTGCTFAAAIKYSAPAEVRSFSGARVESLHASSDAVAVAVQPLNEVVSASTMGLVVPLVPMSVGDQPFRAGQPFQIALLFEPKNAEIRLRPAKVRLELGGVTHTPRFATSLHTHIVQRRSASEADVGFNWQCQNVITPLHISPETEVHVSQKGCVILEFAVATPHPSFAFAVFVDGLTSSHSFLGTPVFRFQQSSRTGFQAFF